MIFEDLPTTPTSEELIDKAFSRAARSGRSKQGREAQESMTQTATNILSDNLQNVVTEWPDFDDVDPFYRELADAIVDASDYGVDAGGVDALRQSLSEVTWASRQTRQIGEDAMAKMRKADVDLARKHRKQAFARMADVVEDVSENLLLINEARNDLRDLPEINPDEPAIVVAGYPNVGKSSFVNGITRARNETAEYPFTTKGIGVGHFERDRVRYQIVDTPGLLDRPPEERNEIESQAVSALEHLADCVLVLLDASMNCGYPVDVQLELRDAIAEQFGDAPVMTVCNKSDLSTDVEADHYMSVETGENVESVVDAAVEAIDWEQELPFER
ncbi:NOG1 family protein [Natronoarchaeum rubrum]|uniref:NOG1 family protein n=1 Tax=Natronoarchaeum rubrum TaxID=755311 RepID=UPI002112722D|nr:GTPase [Natronoarchaeum rubrum]